MEVLLLFALCFSKVFCDVNLTILHTNDLHARYGEINQEYGECGPKENVSGTGCFGGYARIAYRIKEFRNEAGATKDREVLYLDAGNSFSGSRLFAVHKAKIAGDFMNLLKPDALALGNHELSYGMDQLQAFTESLASPVVSSNINLQNASAFRNVKKSVVLERKGVKVGIIGYTSPQFDAVGSQLTDEVAAVKAESERLDKAGVKILIAVGNSGFETDKRIAYYVPLIDIVVGGYSRTFLYGDNPPSSELPADKYPKVITQPSRKDVLVVQAFAYSKYLGCLNVTFDDKGDVVAYSGRPLLLASTVPEDTYAFMRPLLEASITPQDEEVVDLLNQYEASTASPKMVGNTSVVLDAEGDACHHRECNFGNLVADSIVLYVTSNATLPEGSSQPHVIGIINGGAIGESIDATAANGTITNVDVLYTLPYPDSIVTCSIKGRDLLTTLERNLEFGKAKCRGEFLQFSGLNVVYDLYKHYKERVVYAEIPGNKGNGSGSVRVNPDGDYNIVSTDYLVESKCAYILNCYNKKSVPVTYGEAVTWYLSKYSPIKTGLENRIMLRKRTP